MVISSTLVGHPAALTADPAATHVEDLHGRLQLVLGDGDEVGVGRVGEHDRVLLHGLLQGLDVVAQAGGPLVLHLLRRLHHLLLQTTEVRARAARHEVAELRGQLPVVLGGDPADAGGGALADVAEQTGPAGAGGVLEDARRAGAHREHPKQQVDGVPDGPGVRVRSEVADALLLVPAHHLHARELLVHRDREVRVALVVAVLDVEPGVVLLDPGVLQLQRLHLGGHHGPLHRRGGGHHAPGARVQVRQVLEIVRQALAQALRLPDVDHTAVLVTEPVHPGTVRDVSRPGAVAGGVGHVSHPTNEHRHRVGPVDGPGRTAPRPPGGRCSPLRPVCPARSGEPCPRSVRRSRSGHAADAPEVTVFPARPLIRPRRSGAGPLSRPRNGRVRPVVRSDRVRGVVAFWSTRFNAREVGARAQRTGARPARPRASAEPTGVVPHTAQAV